MAEDLEVFLSTHPLRGATHGMAFKPWHHGYFYPRTPCGVRLSYGPICPRHNLISIHAPPAGCDCDRQDVGKMVQNFYPRTPCGVRLCLWPAALALQQFLSTHPLRGATIPNLLDTGNWLDFYPRTPCGVRPVSSWPGMVTSTFLSTHPLRGATTSTIFFPKPFHISIHAPPAGCDLTKRALTSAVKSISIHAPPAGCDTNYCCIASFAWNFYPRTPCGVRLLVNLE